MKKAWLWWFSAVALLMLASPGMAEIKSVKVCDAKTLAASNANTYGLGNGIADCTYTDLSLYEYFSFQVYCGETTDDSMSIDVDWVGGSAASAAYMAVPVGTAQLKTSYTTEDAWSAIQFIGPPVSPIGTIRLTNNNTDDDIVCTVILNMGD
jgi:hypothetical protein